MQLGASKKEEGPLRKVPGNRDHSTIHLPHPFIHLSTVRMYFPEHAPFPGSGNICTVSPPPAPHPKLRPSLALGSHCFSLSRFVCKHTFLRPLYSSAQFLRGRGECSGEMVAVAMEFIRAAGN